MDFGYRSGISRRSEFQRLKDDLRKSGKSRRRANQRQNRSIRRLKEVKDQQEQINVTKSYLVVKSNELKRLERNLLLLKKQEEQIANAMMKRELRIKELKNERAILVEQIDNYNPKLEDLGQQLNKTLKRIQLTKQDKCNTILESVLPIVIEKLKKANCLFNRMYKCPAYTGSYYEKLRIKDSGDFDINLVLDLPTETELVQIIPQNPPSYAKLRLKKKVDNLDLYTEEKRELRYLLDDNDYVVPGQMLQWFQSVVAKAALTNIAVKGVQMIKVTSSGPARTLMIHLKGSKTISIDLVPVFRYSYDHWPADIEDLRKTVVVNSDKEYRNLYLVPKLYKRGHKQTPHEPAQKDFPLIWRMHFADMEKSFLKEKPGARDVIKLLKLLRDSQKWHSLCSYELKTLVMNDIAENPHNTWQKSVLPERLLEMLLELKDCLDRGHLPHFFFTTVNLFQYNEPGEMKDISTKLSEIMKIGRDPSLVKKYF